MLLWFSSEVTTLLLKNNLRITLGSISEKAIRIFKLSEKLGILQKMSASVLSNGIEDNLWWHHCSVEQPWHSGDELYLDQRGSGFEAHRMPLVT